MRRVGTAILVLITIISLAVAGWFFQQSRETLRTLSTAESARRTSDQEAKAAQQQLGQLKEAQEVSERAAAEARQELEMMKAAKEAAERASAESRQELETMKAAKEAATSRLNTVGHGDITIACRQWRLT